MKLPLKRPTLSLLALGLVALALFVYVAMRSGPLAPIAVTVAQVESGAIAPAIFGVGTVEARYTYRMGPTSPGRLKRLDVHVGDAVKAGQVLGEMDAVDLQERIRSQESAVLRSQAALQEALARQNYAKTQAGRYEQLSAVGMASQESVALKRQELQIAEASVAAARQELSRARSDQDALHAQRNNLRLVAPAAGVIATREADPGTTIVAGQTIVELVDPGSQWVNVRFDQVNALGLAAGLPARITLRSRTGEAFRGRVLRVEPKGDAVTEETIAKIILEKQPEPLPTFGELAEITVDLPPTAVRPLIPNAAIRRDGHQIGVWQIVDGALHFTPVTLGLADLDGRVQVREGLKSGDQIVVYSEKALASGSRIRVVERIPGVAP